MRVRRLTCLVALLALALVAMPWLAGCSAPKVIDSVWPTADAERVIPKPVGPPRWPLTGLEAPSVDAVTARIVSVKIENSPAARPQTGLGSADVVYETVTEGGITRFNALFHSRVPAVVGPVRSARLSDVHIVPQYRAVFGHVGGDSSLRRTLADRDRFDDMDQFFNPSAYWRAKDRSAPHNMMCDPRKLRDLAIRKRGYDASATVTGLKFTRAAVEGTPTATSVTIPFAPDNKVTWKWDGSAYVRSVNGKPHTDRATGAVYRAANVVVLWARVKQAGRTKWGSAWLEIQLTGSGRCSVLRGGRRFDGTWTAGESAPPALKAADGSVIRLTPGTTWFQVIGNEQDIVLR